ncbi:hypothetical protein AQJ91_34090 [Streptomyces dysideae]|uniref:Uncharacterized protein n=1 Tax=Streptomyces dysideae TaxID=909626 RepID=A0A101UTY6_9ACTN|nr:hypothetical protein AQJ91_34090 [Streptomyces dysideae]
MGLKPAELWSRFDGQGGSCFRCERTGLPVTEIGDITVAGETFALQAWRGLVDGRSRAPAGSTNASCPPWPRRPFDPGQPSVAGIAEEEAVGDQQDQGAADGRAPGGEVEELVLYGPVEELGGEPAAGEGSGDADEGGADEAARIATGQKNFGDRSGQEFQAGQPRRPG